MPHLPEASAYRAAVLNPGLCFADPELRSGQVAKNRLGLALVWAGQSAIVFRLQTPRGLRAVRCFTAQISDQQERYAALNQHLRDQYVPTLVDFAYQQQGIQVNGVWYPMVRMEWVEGLPLDQQIETWLGTGETKQLAALARQWANVTSELHQAEVAHGDLQHENILVSRGYITLVDYDGVFVPALSDRPALEIGHPHYQHPGRTSGDFDLALDNFSALVIYLSLKALSVDPSLWAAFHKDKHLLFLADDFVDPHRSPLILRLKQSSDSEVQTLTKRLEAACQDNLSDVPPLGKVLDTLTRTTVPMSPGGSWRQSWLQTSASTASPVTPTAEPTEEEKEEPVSVTPTPRSDNVKSTPPPPAKNAPAVNTVTAERAEVVTGIAGAGTSSAPSEDEEQAESGWLDWLRENLGRLFGWGDWRRSWQQAGDSPPQVTPPKAQPAAASAPAQYEHVDLAPHIATYLNEHPLAKSQRVVVELERLLEHNASGWESAKLNVIKQAQPPQSTTELKIRDIARGLYVRVILRAQIEERYEVQVTRTPSPRFYRRLLGEMETYNLDRQGQAVPILETFHASQAQPGTYQKVPCTQCNGTGVQTTLCRTCQGTGAVMLPRERRTQCPTCEGSGVLEKRCRACRDGELEAYLKDVKKIYPEHLIAGDFLIEDSGLGQYNKPAKDFDVIWESSVWEQPLNQPPFEVSTLGAADTRSMHETFRQAVNRIIFKTQRAEVEHDVVDQPLDQILSAVFGSVYEEGQPRNAYVVPKRFQVVVEVIPIYKVRYEREVTYMTRRLLILPKSNHAVLEGEIYLQGMGNLEMYAHKEWRQT